LKERNHLENLGVDGGVNIKVYLKKKGWDCVNWIDLAQIRGQVGGCRGRGTETWISIKCG